MRFYILFSVWCSAFAWSSPQWPVQDQHLIFLFQDMNEEIYAFLPGDDEPLFDYAFKREGFARIDSAGALLPAQGRFTAPNQGKTLPQAMKDAAGFCLQVHLDLPDVSTPQTILALARDGKTPDFALTQSGKSLQFSLKTDAGIRTATTPLPSTKNIRLAVSADASGLIMYINGRRVAASEGDASGYSTWSGGQLTLGNGAPGKPGWPGRLDGLALFTAPQAEAAIAADDTAFTQIIKQRRAPFTMQLSAKLVAKSKLPTLKDISPYTESLAVFEYEIVEITQGMYLLDRIRVVHWTILGGQYTPYRDVALGTVAKMTVESFRDNRQLKTINISDTLPVDRNNDNYYDAGGLALK